MSKRMVVYKKNTTDNTDIHKILNSLSKWLYKKNFTTHSESGGTISVNKHNIIWDSDYNKDEKHYVVLTSNQNIRIDELATSGCIPYRRYLDRMVYDANLNGISLIVNIVESVSDSDSDEEVDNDEL